MISCSAAAKEYQWKTTFPSGVALRSCSPWWKIAVFGPMVHVETRLHGNGKSSANVKIVIFN
jgi:hypothetical protein